MLDNVTDMATILALKPGDVVEYQTETFTVESRTAYTSPSRSWTEWVLNPGSEDRRLTLACVRDRVYVGSACRATTDESGRTATLDGREHALEMSGQVDARWVYDGGGTRFDRSTFWHYLAPTGELLEFISGHLGQWTLDFEPSEPSYFEIFAT